MRNGIRSELHFHSWEMLHHESCEVSIFSQGEEILLVQGIHIGFGIFVNNDRRDDDRSTFVGGTNAVD